MTPFEIEFGEFLNRTVTIYELETQLDEFGTPMRPTRRTIATEQCYFMLNNGLLDIGIKMDSTVAGRVYCSPIVVQEGKFASINNRDYVITLCNNYPGDHCELDLKYNGEK